MRIATLQTHAGPKLVVDVDGDYLPDLVLWTPGAGLTCLRNQGNGNNDVNWLKVHVDARSPEVFSYQPQIVPGNRTAVPAP